MIVPTLPLSVGAPNPGASQIEGSLKFYFIDVGHGDATLIQTPGGKNLLIDGGGTDAGLVLYLQSLGIQRIDLMIATHPHPDHIGGLVQALQTFSVAKVVTNGQSAETPVYEHFVAGVAAAGAKYIEVQRGSLISLDGIDLLVLNPPSLRHSGYNENSIVLRFKYGRTTFLMMGDAGEQTEGDLLAAGLPLKADILKVGRHGSLSGSTLAFLDAVQPRVALYSAGIDGKDVLPAPLTIAALKVEGATVYGTDVNGTISIEVGPGGYTVKSTKGAKGVRAIPVTATAALAGTPTGSTGLEIIPATSPVSK